MNEKKLNPIYEELLNDCTPEVKRFLVAVIQDLAKDYGDIDNSWYCTLRLVKDTYQLYVECYEEVKKSGTVELDGQGKRVKNKYLSCLFECQRTLQALLKSFGYTPVSKTRLRALKKENKEVHTALDDFLASK